MRYARVLLDGTIQPGLYRFPRRSLPHDIRMAYLKLRFDIASPAPCEWLEIRHVLYDKNNVAFGLSGARSRGEFQSVRRKRATLPKFGILAEGLPIGGRIASVSHELRIYGRAIEATLTAEFVTGDSARTITEFITRR